GDLAHLQPRGRDRGPPPHARGGDRHRQARGGGLHAPGHGGPAAHRRDARRRRVSLEPGRAATDAPPPPGGLAARPPKIAPIPALEGRRVLVVDDSVPVARSTARLLELFGARPLAVFSGAEALRRLEAAAFDLVVLDLGLPDLDGCEVLRRARALRPE